MVASVVIASWSWSGSRRRSSSRWGFRHARPRARQLLLAEATIGLVAGSQSWVSWPCPRSSSPARSWSAAGCPTRSSISRAGSSAGCAAGSACRWCWPSTSSRAFGLDDRGRLGHRLDADAAHAARRLQARARRLVGGVGHGHGHLVPPAIFMIVLGQIMDTSVVAISSVASFPPRSPPRA